jgi:hypothetical protein
MFAILQDLDLDLDCWVLHEKWVRFCDVVSSPFNKMRISSPNLCFKRKCSETALITVTSRFCVPCLCYVLLNAWKLFPKLILNSLLYSGNFVFTLLDSTTEWHPQSCKGRKRETDYDLYRVSQEECARLREGVPYVKVCRYNPKHLCPNLNGYGGNGQRSVKLWQVLHTCWLPNTY